MKNAKVSILGRLGWDTGGGRVVRFTVPNCIAYVRPKNMLYIFELSFKRDHPRQNRFRPYFTRTFRSPLLRYWRNCFRKITFSVFKKNKVIRQVYNEQKHPHFSHHFCIILNKFKESEIVPQGKTKSRLLQYANEVSYPALSFMCVTRCHFSKNANFAILFFAVALNKCKQVIDQNPSSGRYAEAARQLLPKGSRRHYIWILLDAFFLSCFVAMASHG